MSAQRTRSALTSSVRLRHYQETCQGIRPFLDGEICESEQYGSVFSKRTVSEDRPVTKSRDEVWSRRTKETNKTKRNWVAERGDVRGTRRPGPTFLAKRDLIGR
ncbi:Hypothetical protein CINCED_3A002572 [Cinara cedri]|uniref:Uncharacterized protein n=1 Tax=Cinara cedri TaxID=506608 RepID=A0A5E4MFI2_9HEMI|nr:Hypothetical protein CINCED_3A002572 [Cinara cedri]